MNSQHLCVSQQQLCLSTNDKESSWGSAEVRVTALYGAGRVETSGESSVLFAQGALVCMRDLPKGEGQKCVPVQLLP